MTQEKPRTPVPQEVDRCRRSILTAAVGTALGAPFLGRIASAATEAAKEPPQPGDVFVYASGDRKGQTIAPDDLPMGGPQQLAYPMDPKSETVRDGSRLNQVALVRLDPAELSQDTSKNAADGVVAYSAVCTHQGCPISMWDSKRAALFCSCHASMFDPANAAEVVGGPAPKRLAMLPLKSENGVLMAAGEFIGGVGFKSAGGLKPGLRP
jgi:rieske iron-sulfur protein